MALMAGEGGFDRVLVCVISADTHWEPLIVYEPIDWLASQR